MSQTSVAIALGVTRQTVSKWEKEEPPKMALLALQGMAQNINEPPHPNSLPPIPEAWKEVLRAALDDCEAV